MITLLIDVNTLNESSYYFVNIKVAGHMHGRGITVYTFLKISISKVDRTPRRRVDRCGVTPMYKNEASVLVNLVGLLMASISFNI